MRGTPIITLGYALASLNTVQATSFLTVTKTVIKDSLVGSVDAASLAPTLDRRSIPKLTEASREDTPPDEQENTFSNREEYFQPDNGLPEDVILTDLAMTLKTKGEEFAFTTKLSLEPWPLQLSDLIRSKPKPKIEPTEPTGPPNPLGTGSRGRLSLTRAPQATPQPEAEPSPDPMVTNLAMTLNTKGEAFVFTTKLTMEAWPDDPADYPKGTPRHEDEKEDGAPPDGTPTVAPSIKPSKYAADTKDSGNLEARSPSSSPIDDDDTPGYPKTIRLPNTQPKGPTRDIRMVGTFTRHIKPSIPLTAIPTDWPRRIGPDEDPLDPIKWMKLPEIVNPDWQPEPPKEKPPTRTTAHHYCKIFPHPMSLCTDSSWLREHMLETRTPPGELVRRGEATAKGDAGLMMENVVTATVTSTATVTGV